MNSGTVLPVVHRTLPGVEVGDWVGVICHEWELADTCICDSPLFLLNVSESRIFQAWGLIGVKVHFVYSPQERSLDLAAFFTYSPIPFLQFHLPFIRFTLQIPDRSDSQQLHVTLLSY